MIKLSIKGNYILKKAFTLAEVLLVMGIIGVVAALTLPLIINNTNLAEYKSAYKKKYSELSNAMNLVIDDQGGSLAGVFSDTVGLRDELLKHLSYTKTCNGLTMLGTCLPSAIYSLNTALATPGASATREAVTLIDGAYFYMELTDKNCATPNGTLSKVCGWIIVDINGLKGPNTYGKDIYYLHVLDNGIKPSGAEVPPSYWYDSTRASSCDPNRTGRYCAAAYLLNE